MEQTPYTSSTDSSIELLRFRAKVELELRHRIGSTFHSFISYVQPKYEWYRHCQVIASVLEQVEKGELKRVMFWLPPRHSKSETVSRLFPAYFLYKNPTKEVGFASYGADLAHHLSRAARDNYEASRRPLNPDVSATKEWETFEGGSMWSAGAGGPITGKGGNLLIIDDPYKDQTEAMSSTIRENVKDWYRTIWITRREPDAAEIIIQTRWHEDDLCGWLLGEEEQKNPQHWHIVNLEAIKTNDFYDMPRSCTVEKDWRKLGEALCPERFNEKTLQSIRLTQGERFFQAMYQQRPRMQEGDIWKREWFKKIDIHEMPRRLLNLGTDWDCAYTKDEENSANAFLESASDGVNMYVLDVDWRWCEFPDLISWMKDRKAPHYIEAKASGKSAKQTLVNNGVAAREVQISGGDKTVRTILASPFAERGNVYVAAHIWEKLLDDPKQGILHFPKGVFNDLNDAFVQAINRHFKMRHVKILTSA